MWLKPWLAGKHVTKAACALVEAQLAAETQPGHPLFDVPVRLLARKQGDDALFALLDGSKRVAVVYLQWQSRQIPPKPRCEIYANLEEWRSDCMVPDHQEWIED